MANTQLGKFSSGVINLDAAIGNLLSQGAGSLGLGKLSDALRKRTAKRTEKQTRWMNTTGSDDPFLLAAIKDYYRPERQAAVGLGMLASKIGGGDVSNYLQPGTQGIGDWSFLLDEEEAKALQERPGFEAAKSLMNIGGRYATGGLTSAYGQAAQSAPTAAGRVLGKGSLALPGNILQALGQTEEYRGESPVASAIGASVGSYLFPAAEEALGVIGKIGKGKSIDELRESAFKSAGIGDEQIQKLDDFYAQMGTEKDQLLKDIELLQRGKKVADMTVAEKNSIKDYLLSMRGSGVVDEGQVNMLLREYGVKPGEVSIIGINDQKLKDYGINKNNIDKIGGSDKAKQGIAVFEGEADRLGLDVGDRVAKEKAISPVIGGLDEQLKPELAKVPSVSKESILNDFQDSVKNIKNYESNAAYVEFTNMLNQYGDELNGDDLRNLFTSIQKAGKLEQLSPSARAATTRIFSSARDSVRNKITGKAGALMSKIGSVMDIASAITKRSQADLGPTIFGMKMSSPALTKAVDRTAGAIGSGLGAVGTGIESVGQIAGQIPGQMAGQLGGMVGRSFEDTGVQGVQDGGLGGGVPGEGPMGASANIEVPGFQWGSDDDPLGLYQQQQQQQQAFNYKKLNVDLSNAVLRGDISASDAQYVMTAMQQAYGGGSITDQIERVAQSDPEQAQMMLGQAVLSGEISPSAAKSYAEFAGLSSGKDASTHQIGAQSGLNSLSDMEEILDKNSGVLGSQLAGGGSISQIIGGEDYQRYQNAAYNAADLILRIRTGAQANESEIKLYMKEFMPKWFESEEVRQSKLDRMKEYLEGVKSGKVTPETGESESISNDYDSWME